MKLWIYQATKNARKETYYVLGVRGRIFGKLKVRLWVITHFIRYCQSMTVSNEISGKQGKKKGLKVLFTSDKKKFGGGAQCTAVCTDPAPTTTTKTTTTTTTTTTSTTTTTTTTTTAYQLLLPSHCYGNSTANDIASAVKGM